MLRSIFIFGVENTDGYANGVCIQATNGDVTHILLLLPTILFAFLAQMCK